MKKVLKITGAIITFLLLLILIGGVYINSSDLPVYPTQTVEFEVYSDSATIAEGARMASMLCVNCHQSEDGKLGGAYMADAGGFGEIYSRNITQHPKYGITDYTDGELAYLLRTGIKKDGMYSPPYMPKFPNLSDKDLNSIIAFLRSDHPLVQPSEITPPECKPNMLTKVLSRIAFKPLPYPKAPIPEPNKKDKVEYGKYLATAKFDCYSCHSADFKTMDPLVPENSEGFFGGGNVMPDKEGGLIVTANITMNKETGIGEWTEEEFIRAVKYGIRPQGEALKYPMAPYANMTDEEVSAIFAYLQTLPEINNDVSLALKR